MPRSGAEQPLVVRIAAHHPMEDDDVGRLDVVRRLSEVYPEAPLDAPLEAGGVDESLGIRFIPG